MEGIQICLNEVPHSFSSLLAFYNFIKKAFSQNTETCTETSSDSVDLKFGVEDSNINELREILNKSSFQKTEKTKDAQCLTLMK